jgi:hypothetical protein
VLFAGLTSPQAPATVEIPSATPSRTRIRFIGPCHASAGTFEFITVWEHTKSRPHTSAIFTYIAAPAPDRQEIDEMCESARRSRTPFQGEIRVNKRRP